MPTSYTSKLRLAKPATGELSGSWGDTVNNGITDLVDTAIAGYTGIALSDANYTLSTANGASDEARSMMLNVTGSLTANRDLVIPNSGKVYIVRNNTTGGFSLNVKTSGGSAFTLPNGKTEILCCDGSNVVFEAFNYFNSVSFGTLNAVGNLTVDGNTILGNASSDTLTIAPNAVTWSNNPTHSGNHTFSGTVTLSSTFAANGNMSLGDAAGDTLTIAPSAVTWSNSPTHSGNHTFSGDVSHNGGTTLGNAAGDALTINSNTITWTNAPTHSGNHTFSGTVTATTFSGSGASLSSVPATSLTGNLAIARFNSGTGATSSTFWRGDGTWSSVAAAAHVHDAADITAGILAVARGGTGIGSYTANNFIRASGATTLEQRTPAQVLTDIGALAVAGGSMTGRFVSAPGSTTGNSGMATATGSLGEIEVRGNGTGASIMTFHRPGSFAGYFGLDTDNVWKIGGWSHGAAAYTLWHSGNDGAGSGLDADLLDGLSSASFLRREVNTWQSDSEGTERYYLASGNGRIYFKSGGGHEWRHTGDATRAILDTSGNYTAVGLLYGRNGGAGLGQITISTAAPSGGAAGDLWLRY